MMKVIVLYSQTKDSPIFRINFSHQLVRKVLLNLQIHIQGRKKLGRKRTVIAMPGV
jgi:hypothetical protein